MLELLFCSVIVLLSVFLYLFYRCVRLLEKLVEYGGKKESPTTPSRIFVATENPIVQERKEAAASFKVPELAPEHIAPNLRTPPKTSGFGSGGGSKSKSDN